MLVRSGYLLPRTGRVRYLLLRALSGVAVQHPGHDGGTVAGRSAVVAGSVSSTKTAGPDRELVGGRAFAAHGHATDAGQPAGIPGQSQCRRFVADRLVRPSCGTGGAGRLR